MKTLKDWCIENEQDLLLELYENAENKLKSNEIGFSSSANVNWKCKECNMEWKRTLNKATKKTKTELKGCLYCNHQRPSPMYNLITEYPILQEEWDYEKNSKQPTEYLPKSKEKVWWKCKNGHSWKSIISDRVRCINRNISKGRLICPFCNHERVSNTYNLVTEFPNIAKQWNYIKNGSVTPLQISPKSPKKVWWICEYNTNHIWQDRIGNRTILNRKCPICSKKFTISFPARVLYYYLKQYFHDCEIEFKIFSKYILDIYIPYYKIGIEYDGWYYHSSKESKNREEEKDKILGEKNIKMIRIKEKREETKDIIYENNVISYHLQEGYKNLDELVKETLYIIEEITHVNIDKDINWRRDYQKIEDLYYHVRKSNSLAVKNPELAKEWSDNNNILPDSINTGWQHKVKWICPKCNKEYEASVYNRIRNKSGCPYCSNRKVCENNSLSKKSPEIAEEWNYEKNGDLLPENVTNGCDKKVWWKCKKGHEWEARIYARTGIQKSNCPYCSHRALTPENSLEARNPELNKIWNYEKNENKMPKDFSYASNKIVWWKCDKGHEWKMRINTLRGIKSEKKCPYCRNVRLSSDNSLAAVNEKLKREWCYEKNSELKPENFLPSSNKKVWWRCEEGHIWEARIDLRNKGQGCPYCARVRVSSKNSLSENAKELLKEWNYERNIDNTPETISICSGKKVWWKCKKGHEWLDTVYHRTSGRGCPYCSGRRVTEENSLLKASPEISKEWNYEKNGTLRPENVSRRSGKKVWWKCEKGHEWQTTICNRQKGTNCPICWEERRSKK